MIVLPKRVEAVQLLTDKLTVRQITSFGYINALVDLAEAAHKASRFSYIPFSAEKVRKIAAKAISSPQNSVVFLATAPSGPVGVLHASVGEFHIGTEVKIATIHVLNVPKRKNLGLLSGKVAIGLMKAVKNWAKDKGAVEILFSVTDGGDSGASRAFVQKQGFEAIGGNYVKSA